MKKNIRILLVEDVPGDIRLIEEMLQSEVQADSHLPRLEIETALSDNEAITKLERFHYDVILLDIFLEGSARMGDDLIVDIRKITPFTPIIMLTSDASLNRARKSYQAGAYFYYIKDDIANPGKKDIDHLITSMINAVKMSRLLSAAFLSYSILRKNVKDMMEHPELGKSAEIFRKDLARELLLLDSFSDMLEVIHSPRWMEKKPVHIKNMLNDILTDLKIAVDGPDAQAMTDSGYLKKAFQFLFASIIDRVDALRVALDEEESALRVTIRGDVRTDQGVVSLDDMSAVIKNTANIIEALDGALEMDTRTKKDKTAIQVVVRLPKASVIQNLRAEE
jgi:CheY-like chemotaxis protein